MSRPENQIEGEFALPDQVKSIVCSLEGREEIFLEGVEAVGEEIQKRFTDCIIVGDAWNRRSCAVLSLDDYASDERYKMTPHLNALDSRDLNAEFSVRASLFTTPGEEMIEGETIGEIQIKRTIQNNVLPCDIESWLEYQIVHTYNGGFVLQLDEPISKNTTVANARGHELEQDDMLRRVSDLQTQDLEAFANGERLPSDAIKEIVKRLYPENPVDEEATFMASFFKGMINPTEEQLRAQREEMRKWAHQALLEQAEGGVQITRREAEELIALLRPA